MQVIFLYLSLCSLTNIFIYVKLFSVKDMGKDNNLSKRQNEVLTFIKKYIAKNGYSPSVREVANGVQLNSPATVHVHLQNLISLGYLKRDNDHAKSLELLVPNEFEVNDGDAIAVPFIHPKLVKDFYHELEHPDEFFYLTSDMVSSRADVFVMFIPDNKLSAFGILKGDNAVIEMTHTVFQNDIIVYFDDDKNITVRKIINSEEIPDNIIIGKIHSIYREY